eukprot:1147901-Pelagomonas_calceolata.AAC.7
MQPHFASARTQAHTGHGHYITWRAHATSNNACTETDLAARPPRAYAKSFDDQSSSDIVAFGFHAGDDMILAA